MKNAFIALAIGVVTVAAEGQTRPAWDGSGTLLTCESKNNVRHTCKVDVRGRQVVVNQQLSDNACVLGRSWGVNRNRKSIWVDGGCRAEFLVGNSGMASTAFGRSVVCESQNNGRRVCPVDTGYGVQLARQISKNGCARGQDWGFDENGIWVDHGCRAEFVLGGESRFVPMTSSTARGNIVCESQNNALNRCSADTYYGVSLARQLSQNACVRGRSWGFDANGIWVKDGCRAEFVVGY